MPEDDNINNNNGKLVSHQKIQMQTQQHTLPCNRETRNEKSVKNMEISCKSLRREFHAVGAEKPKLRLKMV